MIEVGQTWLSPSYPDGVRTEIRVIDVMEAIGLGVFTCRECDEIWTESFEISWLEEYGTLKE